jgi:hypothetical protein
MIFAARRLWHEFTMLILVEVNPVVLFAAWVSKARPSPPFRGRGP